MELKELQEVLELRTKLLRVKDAFAHVMGVSTQNNPSTYHMAYSYWMSICQNEGFDHVCSAPHGIKEWEDQINAFCTENQEELLEYAEMYLRRERLV